MTTSTPEEGDRLRRVFAHAAPAPSLDPVEPEVLWRAARGRAEPAEVARLAERMAEDPALAEDWRIAVAFAAAEAEDEAGRAPPLEPAVPAGLHAASREGEPANHGDYTRWGAVVALLAAAVLLVLAWPRGGPPRPGTAADPGALRGAQGGITALRGEGVTARDQATLEWSAVPGAVRYELHVSTPELEPVLSERSLPTPRAVLPEAILRPMPAGTELLWRVEAVLDDEQRVVSPTFSLTVE